MIDEKHPWYNKATCTVNFLPVIFSSSEGYFQPLNYGRRKFSPR